MSELQTLQQPTPAPEPEEADTEEEFRAIYTDATEGRERFEALAKSAEKAGHPEVASVYREISVTVLSLLAEMAMSTAGAIMNVEDAVDALPGGDADGSSLLQEDADKYLSLFDQYIRLLDGLSGIVPAGSDGDAQREIFAKLRRLTEGMIDYTKSIVTEPDDDDDDDDEDPEDDSE